MLLLHGKGLCLRSGCSFVSQDPCPDCMAVKEIGKSVRALPFGEGVCLRPGSFFISPLPRWDLRVENHHGSLPGRSICRRLFVRLRIVTYAKQPVVLDGTRCARAKILHVQLRKCHPSTSRRIHSSLLLCGCRNVLRLHGCQMCRGLCVG